MQPTAGSSVSTPPDAAPPAAAARSSAEEFANHVVVPLFPTGRTDGSIELPPATDDSPTIISKTARAGEPPPAAAPPGARPSGGSAVNGLYGRRLAHFELLAPIGVGGMAAVIRARDTQLERIVALKILPPEMAANPENIKRFQQEARAAAKLDHENIARVFYCGEDQRLHFIAFEFVEGDNLRTILDRRGRLPVDEAIHYLLQITTGLEHAASRGVVHRDIKPSNIIVSPSRRAKLVDMGLARSLERHGETDLTQSGMTLGTFDYISPEQALEPRDADVRSDIYSLGCTFYHMITGQPPVPDGTAAKKLHHHQHVKPVDPRLLHPDIPDAVAAVVARMMAKDPKDRYQKPEHLVQHLIQLAQQLGTAPAVSEGVLFLDAPLPTPPQTRPLLMAAFAAVALVLMVSLLGQSPSDPGVTPAGPQTRPGTVRGSEPSGETGITAATVPNAAGTPPGSGGPQAPASTDPARTAPVTSAPRPEPVIEIQTETQLAKAVAHQDARTVRLQIRGVVNLKELISADSGGDTPQELVSALVIDDRREWVIEPAPSAAGKSEKPVLRLTYPLGFRDNLSALTVRGGANVTFRNLRLEIDSKGSTVRMAAVTAQDNATLTFENCEFVQSSDSPFKQGPAPRQGAGQLTAIAVEGSFGLAGPRAPKVVCKRCFFAGGQDAITVRGPSAVSASECAFGRYAALIRAYPMRRPDDRRGEEPSLSLDQCSAITMGGPVLELDDGATARLECKRCVFSHAGENTGSGPAAVVWQVGQDSDQPAFGPGYPALRLNGGRHNYYHRFQDFLVQSYTAQDTPVRPNSGYGDFAHICRAEGSTLGLASPWQADEKNEASVAETQAALATRPADAFRINPGLREVRSPENPETKLLGPEVSPWGRAYDKLPPLSVAGTTRPPLVVDPNVKQSERNRNIYRTLTQAIDDAQPGDEIQIRQGPNRLVAIDPVSLLKPSTDLLIKPYRNERPILVLGASSERQPAVFRIQDGTLRLERLEFLLRPGEHTSGPGYDALSVVRVEGACLCQIKQCLVTLQPDGGMSAALVSMADPSSITRMAGTTQPARKVPELDVEDSFVRGTGDVLSVAASQPFMFTLRQSLVALHGSLITVEGHKTEPDSRAAATVSLAAVTSYLTENLLSLRAFRSDKPTAVRGLVPTTVTATGCLFLSARGNSLIHVDGADEDRLDQLFKWTGQRNVYSNFTQMLDQVSRGDGMGASFSSDRWMRNYTEDQGVFEKKVAVPASAVPEADLVKAVPDQFRPKPDSAAGTAGANLDRLGGVLQPSLKDSEEASRGP